MSVALLAATAAALTCFYLLSGFDTGAHIAAPGYQLSAALTAAPGSGDNTTYLGSNARTGFDAAETAITTATARNLAEAWSAPSYGNSFVSSQVITSAGVAFWGDKDGYEHATDMVTGRQVWLSPQLGVLQQSQVSCPGYAPQGISGSATVGQIGSRKVVYVADGLANEYALDASTGAIVWKTNLAPVNQEIFGSAALYNGSLYIGLSSDGDCPLTQGKLFKLDAATGAVQATFNVVPAGCVGGGVWSSPAIDAADNAVYIATGNPLPTSTCSEPYAQAIVKVRADTLTYVSSWQAPVPASADYDFGATPTLFTATINGVARQLVGAVNKNGTFYALDRTNLAAGPVWTYQVSDPGSEPGIGQGSMAPASFDGTNLYVGGGSLGSCASELAAVNPATGVPLWQDCITDGHIIGGVVTAPGLVVAGAGAYVDVFDAATGARLLHWTDGASGGYFSAPTISHGWVLIPKSSGVLNALTVLPPPAVAVGVEGTDGALWVRAPQLGGGWHSLGGKIIAPPAVAAAPNPGGATPVQPLFIATGTDKHLYIRSLTAGWQRLGPATASCLGGPAAVITGGRLWVACEGLNKALFDNTAPVPASGLPQFKNSWKSLGGVLSAGPAVARVGSTMTFFVRGTNGHIYIRTLTAGYAAMPWVCIGAPAAAQLPAGGETIFACQGGNHALWEATNWGSGWTGAVSLGGSLIGGPAVAATSQETEFMAEGPYHAIWERTAAPWLSLGGVAIGGVGATALN